TLSSFIKSSTILSRKTCAACSKRLPKGCDDPSASYFVPAGNSITVLASAPIAELGFVDNNTTSASTDLAFSTNNLKCSVEPEPEITINKSFSVIEGVVNSPITYAYFPSWFKRIAKLFATNPERPLPATNT